MQEILKKNKVSASLLEEFYLAVLTYGFNVIHSQSFIKTISAQNSSADKKLNHDFTSQYKLSDYVQLIQNITYNENYNSIEKYILQNSHFIKEFYNLKIQKADKFSTKRDNNNNTHEYIGHNNANMHPHMAGDNKHLIFIHKCKLISYQENLKSLEENGEDNNPNLQTIRSNIQLEKKYIERFKQTQTDKLINNIFCTIFSGALYLIYLIYKHITSIPYEKILRDKILQSDKSTIKTQSHKNFSVKTVEDKCI